MKCIILILVLLSHTVSLVFSSPIDRLRSPSQSVRDKAAEEIRQSYVCKPRAYWTSRIEQIKTGQTKSEISKILQPFKPRESTFHGFNQSQSHYQDYRLDSNWVLTCLVDDESTELIGYTLTLWIELIWVAPSTDFTGKWITYFANGKKASEKNYKNGRYFGEVISYRQDGSKCYVQHYNQKGATGLHTGYYPSGKIKYQGKYIDGQKVGVWQWYDENGNPTSQQEHSKQ